MPELPEVETIMRTLEKSLLGEEILSLDFLYPKLLEDDSDYDIDSLKHKTFTGFYRRGKYCLFELDDNLYWIVHLRMEGKFHLYDKVTKPSKHTHLVLRTNQYEVHYLDVRKFSRMSITKRPMNYFVKKNLGLEPFDTELNADYLYQSLKRSRRPLKALLLDQSIVAGIGNIYADEILFDSKIHPLKLGSHISKNQALRLSFSIPKILNQAIEAGGTTIRSYTSALNVHGRFQISLKVYGRENQECYECGSLIKKIKVAQRGTSFCPSCQTKR